MIKLFILILINFIGVSPKRIKKGNILLRKLRMIDVTNQTKEKDKFISFEHFKKDNYLWEINFYFTIKNPKFNLIWSSVMILFSFIFLFFFNKNNICQLIIIVAGNIFSCYMFSTFLTNMIFNNSKIMFYILFIIYIVFYSIIIFFYKITTYLNLLMNELVLIIIFFNLGFGLTNELIVLGIYIGVEVVLIIILSKLDIEKYLISIFSILSMLITLGSFYFINYFKYKKKDFVLEVLFDHKLKEKKTLYLIPTITYYILMIFQIIKYKLTDKSIAKVNEHY